MCIPIAGQHYSIRTFINQSPTSSSPVEICMYFAEPLKDPNGFASRKLPFLPIAIQILVDIFMFKIFTVLAANCESIDNPENLVSLN